MKLYVIWIQPLLISSLYFITTGTESITKVENLRKINCYEPEINIGLFSGSWSKF
jgi:hypothetical protein